jgi:Cu(I)/Ag(I) efflux system membrane fusion protein
MNRTTLIAAGSAALLLAGALLWQRGSDRGTDRSGAAMSAPAAAAPASGATARPGDGADRRILYYRNPMGLPDTSPAPKRDAMGMDYVPVYADEQTSGGTVRIGADRLQKLGVRTELAAPRVLVQTLRIVGTLQADESRLSTVSPRFEGWITRLLVGTTGARVQRGQPLLEVYSPELVSAQEDYRVAVRAQQALADGDATARANMAGLVQGSLERLRNWDIDPLDLAGLRAGEPPRRSLVLRAQHAGVVIEKSARVGMRFMPGEPLYQIADLSTVWLIGNVFEQDLAQVQLGAAASVSVVAYPGRVFRGKVSFIAPVLQPETRTAQVRIELPNPRGLLKPAMYASVDLATGSQAPRLAVPEPAILDTGTRQLVLVDRGAGEFEPRPVRTGIHADGYTEILAGVVAGEAVVVNGNFLIDSESNLRAAFGALGTKPPVPAPQAGH